MVEIEPERCKEILGAVRPRLNSGDLQRRLPVRVEYDNANHKRSVGLLREIEPHRFEHFLSARLPDSLRASEVKPLGVNENLPPHSRIAVNPEFRKSSPSAAERTLHLHFPFEKIFRSCAKSLASQGLRRFVGRGAESNPFKFVSRAVKERL